MFELDLEITDLGEWFPFQDSHFDAEKEDWVFDPPASDARVKVRRMVPFFLERMPKRRRGVEHVLNPKTKAMERITYFEDLPPAEAQKENDDAWDYVITAFEGFQNKGEVIECTRENKLKMMKVPAFDRFITRCLKILEGSVAKEKEAAEKN